MTAAEIVEKIIDDIRDRQGLGDEFDAIDEDIQEEIKAKWIAIIKGELC
jgi:hypothetical protein